MASAQSSQKLASKLKVTHTLSGDASTPKDISWVDMRDYEYFMVTATAAALTGVGVTVFTIVANAESDGGGTDVEIKAHAVGSAPDAAGDTLVLECTAEELAYLGAANSKDLRYVSAKITAANASDNIVCTYIRAGARFAEDGLTADSVA